MSGQNNILSESRNILPTFVGRGTKASLERKARQEVLGRFFPCKLD